MIEYGNIDLSKVIYNQRIEKGMTQENLANGICSISYLSKLENKQLDPSKEILALLLDKLDIEIKDFLEDHKYFEVRIDKLNQAIIRKDINGSKGIYDELNYMVGSIKDPEYICAFNLIKVKYLLTNNLLEEAKRTIDFISTFHSKRSLKHNIQFLHLSGIYYCRLKEYLKGLDLLKKAEVLSNKHNLSLAEISYHIALTYSLTYNTTLAIYYAQKALKLNYEEMNYLRCLDCELIIGMNFVRIKSYTKAESTYLNILAQAETLEQKELKATVLHNLGFLYYKVRDYQKAKFYYIKSLDNKEPNSTPYQNTIIYLCETLIKTSQDTEATFWLGTIEENNYDDEYYHLFQLMKLKIKDHESYIEYCERKVFPFFISVSNVDSILKYGEELANHYSSKKMYKKTSDVYKKMLGIIKKIYREA
ncbi:helix-turn-helix domain-containing protein [Virgibacillus pantothenticus]|uniref:helix-turn-helix domain-containing protein n=2 Tax=Bacillati TaxID=1783272 RepID=UPI00147A9F3E|nr:helix-turn-helix domain-containing protein [Virgibacillus pantothenticus]GIP63139.1 transcriptional regulator [Virgibacillus pantothenticus]